MGAAQGPRGAGGMKESLQPPSSPPAPLWNTPMAAQGLKAPILASQVSGANVWDLSPWVSEQSALCLRSHGLRMNPRTLRLLL